MMKTRLILILVVLLQLQFASAQRPKGTLRKPGGKDLTPKTMDTQSEKLLARAKVEGLGVAVIDAEKAYVKPYGHRDLEQDQLLEGETILMGGTLSAPIMAVLVLKLADQKEFDLDKPLLQYLPSQTQYAIRNDNPAGTEKISARDCLLEKQPEQLDYLQFVLENYLGKGFDVLADEVVFEPFGMKRSSFIWQPKLFEDNQSLGYAEDGAKLTMPHLMTPQASRSFYTTLADYTRFIQKMLLQNGRDAKLFAPLFTGATATSEKIAQTLGFQTVKCRFGRTFIATAETNGFRHYLIGFPDKRSAILLLSNSTKSTRIFKDLSEKLLDEDCTPWQELGFTRSSLDP